MGKLVKSLSESFASSGLHEIGFSTADLGMGVYQVRVSLGSNYGVGRVLRM